MKPIIKVGQALKRRRMNQRTWLVRQDGRTAARYALLTVAGVLLYMLGAAYTLRERGYFAVGGEALAIGSAASRRAILGK